MTEIEIDISNRIKQLRKGLIEYLLLLILEKKPQYTKEIIEAFEAADSSVIEGTLYPLLSRLSKQGIVSYQWVEAQTGHPRKYYELTKTGKQVLRHLQTEWASIEQTVKQLKNN